MPRPDARIWRVVGEPLLRPTAAGPLDGHTVAVKDVFAVEGFPLGAGVPAYLAEAERAARSAASLRALQAAGASVRGIAQTDQFAYSIAGRNPAYGTPPNPAVPGAIPGGSSSGPAAAVAMGDATIGLATDTAGSIRIPASYQGLWGLRTTHGAVSVDGVLPLAPSFDTVGWITRDGETLAAVARACLDTADSRDLGARLVSGSRARGLGDPRRSHVPSPRRSTPSTSRARRSARSTIPHSAPTRSMRCTPRSARCRRPRRGRSTDDGSRRTPARSGMRSPRASRGPPRSRPRRPTRRGPCSTMRRAALDAALGDAVLVLPSAASVAPSTDADGAEIEAIRAATLRMTAVAGATGRPAVSVPGLTAGGGAPIGVCFVGPRASDIALVERALGWSEALKHV